MSITIDYRVSQDFGGHLEWLCCPASRRDGRLLPDPSGRDLMYFGSLRQAEKFLAGYKLVFTPGAQRALESSPPIELRAWCSAS